MDVLMIGNSYTYYNEMPELLTAIAAANGRSLSVRSITKGGRRLQQNLGEDELAAETRSAAGEHWDALFLQEQSVLPATDPERFSESVKGLAELFCGHADRVILYETWARAADCPKLAECGWTREEMDALLQNAYRAAAERIGAELSPVGQAFAQMLRTAPQYDLWRPDRSHPSCFGSSLAAAVHYRTLFGAAPETLGALELPAEEKNAILKLVKV